MSIETINDLKSSKKQYSATVERRAFLKVAGMAAVAAALPFDASATNRVSAQSGEITKEGTYIMKKRKLGTLEVSELGFGNWVSAAATTVRVWTGTRASV